MSIQIASLLVLAYAAPFGHGLGFFGGYYPAAVGAGLPVAYSGFLPPAYPYFGYPTFAPALMATTNAVPVQVENTASGASTSSVSRKRRQVYGFGSPLAYGVDRPLALAYGSPLAYHSAGHPYQHYDGSAPVVAVAPVNAATPFAFPRLTYEFPPAAIAAPPLISASPSLIAAPATTSSDPAPVPAPDTTTETKTV